MAAARHRPAARGRPDLHHGVTAHAATPNFTDTPRIAHAMIYMDDGTRFSGAKHVVTDPLGLEPGDALDGELFPRAHDLRAAGAVLPVARVLPVRPGTVGP